MIGDPSPLGGIPQTIPSIPGGPGANPVLPPPPVPIAESLPPPPDPAEMEAHKDAGNLFSKLFGEKKPKAGTLTPQDIMKIQMSYGGQGEGPGKAPPPPAQGMSDKIALGKGWGGQKAGGAT